MRPINGTPIGSTRGSANTKQVYIISVFLLLICIFVVRIASETKWVTSSLSVTLLLSPDATSNAETLAADVSVEEQIKMQVAAEQLPSTAILFIHRHNFSYHATARFETEKEPPRELTTSTDISANNNDDSALQKSLRVVLCSECNSAKYSKDQLDCSRLILIPAHGQSAPSTIIPWSKLLKLQHNVSQTISECAACAPAICHPRLQDLLSFDEAAPRILRSVSHILPSVPFSYQRPYLKHNSSIDKSMHNDSLVFYNPSILPFHSPELLEAVYIASFHGSVNEYPFIKEDLVAIALLDKNLKILRDVVVDPNAFLRAVHTDMAKSITFYDYRLFYLHGRLYLTDAQLLLSIEVHLSAAAKPSDNITLPVIFGGESLSITAPHGYHYLFQHNGKRLGGKNLALIDHPNGKSAYIELWPVPRTLLEVNFTDGVRFSYGSKEVQLYPKPLPSYLSHELEHIWRKPFKFTADRGTACCVTLENKYFKDLLVTNSSSTSILLASSDDVRIGISHAKSRVPIPDLGYGYLSRFYAVAYDDPYNVVAMSALFCMGWHEGDWKDVKPQSHLKLKHFVYDCPAVHFPSGIASSPKTPDIIVVGYGIQDRQARFVEYSKRELALHIFSPLPKSG